MKQAVWVAMLAVLVCAMVLLLAQPIEDRTDDHLPDWTPATAAPPVLTEVP